jgi:hypothetical protein
VAALDAEGFEIVFRRGQALWGIQPDDARRALLHAQSVPVAFFRIHFKREHSVILSLYVVMIAAAMGRAIPGILSNGEPPRSFAPHQGLPYRMVDRVWRLVCPYLFSSRFTMEIRLPKTAPDPPGRSIVVDLESVFF